MNVIKVKVNFKNRTIYKQGVDLTSGDYNSTKLVFEFDRQDGIKVFEMKDPDGEIVLWSEIENNEITLVGKDEDGNNASLFKEAGKYIFEISLYDGESKLTSAFDYIPVKEEQVKDGDKIATAYLPIFDNLINEVQDLINQTNNLDIDIENSVVTITKKDGTKKSENVKGDKGEKGEKGDKPVKGTDYFTPSDINSMVSQVTEDATSEFNNNVEEKTNEFNSNAELKTTEFNNNAESKTSSFDTNVANQTKTFNDNANDKLDLYNQNILTKTNEFNTNATSKVNEYNTNANNKLEEYNVNANQKIAEYDAHSEELDNKIIDTRNELERVKNDVLETGTDTDTYIHLEDSAMAEYQELSVDGVFEQKTTSGKNLLPMVASSTTINGITFTINKDKSITANGMATNDANLYLGGAILDSGNYIASVLPNGSTATYYMRLGNGETSSSSFIANVGRGDNPFSLSENKFVGGVIIVKKGQTLNNVIFKPMIRLASITDDTYEPYTGGQPSPSPDYPQEIKTIENSLKIISCNKNLIKLTDCETEQFKVENNVITYKITSTDRQYSNYLTVDGTLHRGDANYSPYEALHKGRMYKKISAGTYTLSFSSSISDPGQILVYAIDEEYLGKNYKEIPSVNKKTMSITETTITIDHEMCLFVWFAIKSDTLVNYSNIQIEQSSTATPFEQHLETQITANLPENEFIGKINDTYKDRLKVEYNEEDGQYHLVLNKMIGKIVLDGSEDEIWTVQFTHTSGKSRFRLDTSKFNMKTVSKINEIGKIISTCFLPISVERTWFNYNGIAVDTSKYIFIYNEEISNLSINDFKSWLSTHNTEVYYVLAEPYVVDLGVVDMPITYNEITNLFTDSDLLPQINAKYYRNFISTVRNLQVNEKALKQELIDINTRLSALESATTSVTSESEVTE